jgi:hypothetical protein
MTPIHGIICKRGERDDGGMKTAAGENGRKPCAIAHGMPKTG